MDKFTEGALMALATLNRLHDEPTLCASAVRAMDLEGTDCSDMDEYDKASLIKINENLPDGEKLIGLGIRSDK